MPQICSAQWGVFFYAVFDSENMAVITFAERNAVRHVIFIEADAEPVHKLPDPEALLSI